MQTMMGSPTCSLPREGASCSGAEILTRGELSRIDDQIRIYPGL